MTKTHAQVKAIYGLARAQRMDDDLLHETVASVTGGNPSIRELSFTNANKVILRLDGQPFAATPAARRTVQHHRQKAGVLSVVQPAQLHRIAELASQRSWTGETLRKFCVRQCGNDTPRTTKDASKVIEGLKAMNKREGLWA